MPVPLTPIPVALPATVSIPANGDAVDSASVAAYVQTIINAQKSAADKTPGVATNGLLLWSLPGECVLQEPTPSWSRGYSNGGYPYIRQDILNSEEVFFPIRLVQGMTVGNYGALVAPTVAHAALPAVRPSVYLVEYDIPSSIGGYLPPSMNVYGSTADTSASVAGYEVVHNIFNTAAAFVAGRSYYGIRVQGESGANALTGLRVLAAWVIVYP